MSNSLRLKTDIISLEADSGTAAMQQALTRLPGLFASASTAFGKHIGEPMKALFQKRDFAWIATKIQSRNYADLRTEELFVPPGMQSDLLTYVAELEQCSAMAGNVKKDVLDPFDSWLGSQLGNPDQLKSVTAKIMVQNFKANDVKSAAEKLGIHFATTGRQEAVRPYGMVIRRNNDWNTIIAHTDNINGYFSEEQHKNIVAKMGSIQTRLDMLLQRLQESPNEYQMSPQALKALATTTYEVASALEFYALMRYKAQELNVAMSDNEARMKEWIK